MNAKHTNISRVPIPDTNHGENLESQINPNRGVARTKNKKNYLNF